MDTIKNFHAVKWVRKRRDEMYKEWKEDPKAFDKSVKKAGKELREGVNVEETKKRAAA